MDNFVAILQQHLPNPILFSSCLVVFFSLFLFFKLTRGSGGNHGNLRLPPCPPRLPVIGNLHQLGTLPHQSLRALSEKHGPMMYMHLGHVPTLVVTSGDIVKEIVKTHDLSFSNRPRTTAAKMLLYDCVDVGFAPYGEYWRQVRKVCVLELLSSKRVQSFRFVREQEVVILLDKIRRSCRDEEMINLTEMVLATGSNIIARCILGHDCNNSDGSNRFGELFRRFMGQFMAFCVGDFFPSLGWVDRLTGYMSRLKQTSYELDTFYNQVIEEHKTPKDHQHVQSEIKDFVDILLQLQNKNLLGFDFTKNNLKALLTDMFVGGSDTSLTTMEWTMIELVKNPRKISKAQEEVRRVIGKKAKIEESDINQMNYLKCVVKEAMRLHPATPLLVPRETRESVKLGGYDIPPKTRVLINAYAIHRDSKVWEMAEEFIPERFEDSPIDYNNDPQFQFIPFGGGRRGCPGIALGVAAVEYVVVNLLYWFDWELPSNVNAENMDMTEVYGLTVHRKAPLLVKPILYSH